MENDAERDAYRDTLKRAVTELNEEHSRCKPLHFSSYAPYGSSTAEDEKYAEFIGVSGVCTMAIWKEKEASHD